ncbi:hypothetical protein GF371_04595 [Candidatus Woesearchaeota archaeon]|nr:hypothetical protein [Candidatus Woesearchaeota archaeon]
MKKLFTFCVLTLFLVSMFAVSAIADTDSDADTDSSDGNDLANNPAGPVEIEYIKINGDYYSQEEIITVVRDSDLDIRIKLLGLADADNLRVSARITGLEHGDIEETTRPFEVDAGERYTKNLELQIPGSMPLEDLFLRLLITDRHDSLYEQNYRLRIKADRHLLRIVDTIFSPGMEVEAGTSLLVTAKIFNAGQKGESAKVTFSIPELKISQSDFISYIESGAAAISQELFVRIPDCAEPKEYDAILKVGYGPFAEETTRQITVTEGDRCEKTADKKQEMTFISIGAASQTTQPGQKATYPVSITNLGAESKIYSIFVEGTGEWGNFLVTPSPVLTVDAGESVATFVDITPVEGSSGQKLFTLSFKAGDETIKQATLSINIDGQPAVEGTEGAATTTAKKTKSPTVKMLEILLGIVIVVLIMIALIVAFRRGKSKEEEPEQERKHEFY